MNASGTSGSLPPPSGPPLRRAGIHVLRMAGPLHRPLSNIVNRRAEVRSMTSTLSTHDGRAVLFIHNPKCAGSSLRRLLQTTPNHATPRSVPEGKWRDAFSIVAVRDPVDRFISGYRMVTQSSYDGAHLRELGARGRDATPLEFLQATKASLMRPQSAFVLHPSAAKPRPDIILRFEEIGTWLAQLQEHLALPAMSELPYENAAARDPVRLEGLCRGEGEVARLRQALRSVYAEDCDLLGYPLP